MPSGVELGVQSPPRFAGGDWHLPTSGMTATPAPKFVDRKLGGPTCDGSSGASILRVSPLTGLTNTIAPSPPFAFGTPTSTRSPALTIVPPNPSAGPAGAGSEPPDGTNPLDSAAPAVGAATSASAHNAVKSPPIRRRQLLMSKNPLPDWRAPVTALPGDV